MRTEPTLSRLRALPERRVRRRTGGPSERSFGKGTNAGALPARPTARMPRREFRREEGRKSEERGTDAWIFFVKYLILLPTPERFPGPLRETRRRTTDDTNPNITMKIKPFLFLLLGCATNLLAVTGRAFGQTGDAPSKPTTVLYDRVLGDRETYPEIVLGDVAAQYTPEGLRITGRENVVRLHKYYALGQRTVRYHIRLAEDAVALFQGDKGEFKAYLDMPARTISMEGSPAVYKKIDFIDPAHEYIVDISRDYQRAVFRLIDLYTGQTDQIEATICGQGGCGAGAVCSETVVGRQYDYYCFGLAKGSEMTVRQICVLSPACDLTLLLYGDSITEPDGYFPTKDYPLSWVQLIMRNVKGKAISSGRGGTTIDHLLERIRNELPYLKAKYVMVTIGTNGGNTEANLSELVEYILAQGSVPILNNIPANESGTHIPVNAMIEKIRAKYGIKGCRFDLPTSVGYDGAEVDKNTMWYEDLGERAVYHHPNVEGSARMYARTLIDIPEIYE